MYGNKSIKHKPDGTKYKDFFYYGCKHRTMTRGHKCEYKKQINEELLDGAVAEVIIKLVSNPKFAAMMQQKINMKIDTSAIEQEIANYEKQLRQSYATKSRLIDEIDTLDPDDKHYIKRKAVHAPKGRIRRRPQSGHPFLRCASRGRVCAGADAVFK